MLLRRVESLLRFRVVRTALRTGACTRLYARRPLFDKGLAEEEGLQGGCALVGGRAGGVAAMRHSHMQNPPYQTNQHAHAPTDADPPATASGSSSGKGVPITSTSSTPQSTLAKASLPTWPTSDGHQLHVFWDLDNLHPDSAADIPALVK